MAGINPVIDPLQRKLVCGPEEGQNTTVDGFQVNVIGDTGSGLYNAGDGIDIEGSTINVALTAGYRGAVSGSTVGFDPTGDIVTVTDASVTLNPDTAYKIYATTSAVTLNANVPAAGKWAYDGHIELFVAGTGYVQTGANVVLANALEPDSVNNCTVRFHDGLAIISVEDHIAGYVVVSATGTTAGTLPYALTSATQEYVAFDASLNGATVSLSGSTANGEKHLVGNGYASTTLTGAVDCGTSKFTVANLGLNNVQIAGGTMTLGDAFIPSGSTVAVSGGGIAVEKVTGNGGVIDLGGTHIEVGKSTMIANGVTFSGGSENYGGAIFNANSAGIVSCTSCVFSGNIAANRAGAVYAGGLINSFKGCSFIDNTAIENYGLAAYVGANVTMDITDCTLVNGQTVVVANGAKVEFAGSNVITAKITDAVRNSTGSVTLSSGAIIDLTGNTNATPIAPGGGITFASGGATVKVGDSTASSSYMMDNVNLPAGAALTNTAKVLISDSIANYTSCGISGATLELSGTTNNILFINQTTTASATFLDCTINPNTSTGIATFGARGYWTLSNCTLASGVNFYSALPDLKKVILGGTISVGGRGGFYAIEVGSEGVVLDNTVINASGCVSGRVVDGPITFGANVSVIPFGGGAPVLLNGGSSGTCTYIYRDGTLGTN